MAIILVVQNQIEKTAALRQLLLQQGHHTAIVSDAVRAIEWMASQVPDLVITDYVLSASLDGFGLIRFIRQEPRLQGVRVILCVDAHFKGLREYAINCGATEVWSTEEVTLPAFAESIANITGSGFPACSSKPDELRTPNP